MDYEDPTVSYDDPLVVYCSPVSGGKYVSQVACMQELFCAIKNNNNNKLRGMKDYPDIIMGSSGGNFSNIAALAGNFTEEGILRNILRLKTEMFIKSWFTSGLNFLPSWCGSIFTGHLYDKGQGGREVIKSMFNENTLKTVECWSGVYDEQNKKPKFFCNLSRGESLINPYFFKNEENLYGAMPLEYVEGDLTKFADQAIASGSIPLVVKGIEIDGNKHSDGGCCFPSPITVFSSEISRIVLNTNKQINPNKLIESESGEIFENENIEKTENVIMYEIDEITGKFNKITKSKKNKVIRPLRLFYFSSYEIEESHYEEEKLYSFALFGQVIKQVFNSTMLNDRNAAIGILKNVCGEKEIKHSSFRTMTTEKLQYILKLLEKKMHYVIVFSPHGEPKVNIFDLKEEEVIEKIKHVRNNYSADVWYCDY